MLVCGSIFWISSPIVLYRKVVLTALESSVPPYRATSACARCSVASSYSEEISPKASKVWLWLTCAATLSSLTYCWMDTAELPLAPSVMTPVMLIGLPISFLNALPSAFCIVIV